MDEALPISRTTRPTAPGAARSVLSTPRPAWPARLILAGFATFALVGSCPGSAQAGSSYCTTTGNRTYCDDGRAYYRYGNDIVSKDGRRWHDFGSHVYGPGSDWIAKHGRDRYTTNLGSGPGDEAAILPKILDDARDDDEAEDGDGGDD